MSILNVNDREGARYLISAQLRRGGFEVIEAASGTEALRLAHEHRPEVVVLDLNLPDLSGYEVCRRLKVSPDGTSVLLTSADYTTADSRVEALESGGDAFLVQPFESRELLAMVRALLRVRAAERQAREALRVREDFLSTASHELKTPLTSLLLQLQRLRRSFAEEPFVTSHPVIGTRLESAYRQGRAVAALVDDLLDVSRIQAGRLALTLEPVDLSRLVREMLERYSDDFERAGCETHLDAPEEVVGHWDRLRLEQVVSNLFSNAIKYAPGAPVEISLRSDGDRAVLRVIDHGDGIPAQHQARVFERFERATLDHNRPGMGLGLWIIREVVERQGGSIVLTSEAGKGAAFEVILPKRPSVEQPAARAS